jgi:uncharacterized protein
MNTEKNLYLTPIVKVVGDYCNNHCGYCFYHGLDQTSRKRMSFEVLELFIRQHVELVHGNLSFIWHGGEPLLAGLDFFWEVIRLQKLLVPQSRLVRNSIQTNGTLITDEWAKFFKENNFGVGVSLDGDAESHDLFRITHAGHGTFNNTVRGIKILQKHGVELSVIQTITQANACCAEKNFRFFTDGIGLSSFGINPYLNLSKSNEYMKGQSLSNDVLTQTLVRYIDLWLERDDEALRVREIDSHLSGLYKKRARNCSFNGSCHAFYTVNYDGCVYPCDRLSGNGEFCFGTLAEQTLREILHTKKWQDFMCKTRKLPDDCTLCKWKDSCNNGCTAHRIGGVDGKYYFCQSRQDVFAYLHIKSNQCNV